VLERAVRKAVSSEELIRARGLPARSKMVRLVFEAVVVELLLDGVDCLDRASESIDEVMEAASEETDSDRVVILTPRPSLLQLVSWYGSSPSMLLDVNIPARRRDRH
jgi:hypothetical protein